MNEKIKSLEKVGFGIAIMFGVYWIYSIFIAKNIGIDDSMKSIIGLICLYGLGFAIFISSIKSISSYKIEKKDIKFNKIIQCFLLQFSALILMSMLTTIFTQITGKEITTPMNVLTPANIFLLLIFNPIIEEFVFRKIFADKLLKYGELFYILTSSFCFAIVHSVAIGIPQVLYTFILGLIWSYLYVKTGKLIIPIILHSLSNFFGGILSSIIQGVSQEALGMYSMIMMLLAIIGIVCFIINKKKIVIDNENKIINKLVLKDIFVNKGIIFYIVLTVAMFILKNIIV